MPDLKLNAGRIFIFTTTLIIATADNGCVDSITQIKEYGHESPFLYCLKDGQYTWDSKFAMTDGTGVCEGFSDGTARVKLKDIDILIYGGSTPCLLTKLHYKNMKNGSCISSLVKPFLENFSGKTPSLAQVKEPPLKASTGRDEGEVIYYRFGCVDGRNTVDMCQHNTSFFEGGSTVKMLFNQNSLGTSSSCYCSVTTDDIYSIKARALDIRLNADNQLLFDSYELPPKDFYWWRDDVLSSSFSKISLLNLRSEAPSSVWMNLNGVNLTVTCDNKPLDSPGDKDSHSSSSSGAGFSIVYIIGIIAGCIVLLILMFLMMRCLKQHNHKPEDIDMEDYEVADAIPDRSASYPEEETLISSQLDVEYAKPSKRQGRRSEEEKELYDKPRIYKPMQDEDNEDKVTNNNQSSEISSSIESSSKENLSDDNATTTEPNIYSHLGEKPDIVPSSPSNIYDATGKDDYSVLERHPKTVTTDNVYDIA